MRRLAFPPGVLLALLLGGLFTEPAQAERRILEAAASSPEELVRRFLDLLSENNVDEIQRLAISREEFDAYVYPELPASDPRRNTSADFVWNTLALRSQSTLYSTLNHLGGRNLKFKEMRFTGGSTPYDTYVVHRESLLILEDDDGEEQIVRLFGSVLELDGQFKIFSFFHD